MKNATYIVSGDDKQVVTLTEQQQVHLKGINEEDIQSAVMDGEDLVVTLHDGRVITIENFGVYDFDTTLEIVDDAGAIVPFPIILSSLAGIGGVAALSGSSSNDTTATVAAPTVALNADTGASATDGLTNDGTVHRWRCHLDRRDRHQLRDGRRHLRRGRRAGAPDRCGWQCVRSGRACGC